jgi:hypothetical protein
VFDFGIFVIFYRVFLSHLPNVECMTFSGSVPLVIMRKARQIQVGRLQRLYVHCKPWVARKSLAGIQKFLAIILAFLIRQDVYGLVLFANVPCPGFDSDAEAPLRYRMVSDHINPGMVNETDFESGSRKPIEKNRFAEIADYL